MSENYQIEKIEGIAIIRLLRNLDLDDFLEMIDQVAQSDDSNRRLWDLTGKVTYNSGELQAIAARGKAKWPSASRVAYVAADDLSFGNIRMFEVFREQENYETKAFRERSEALKWLKRWEE